MQALLPAILLCLWSPEVEKDLLKHLGDRAYTSVRCAKEKGGCGRFQEFSVFAEKRECPHCKTRLTVQVNNGRNAPVSKYTEEYARNLLQHAVDKSFEGKFFVKRGVICPELSLTGGSSADLAILKSDRAKGPVPPGEIIAVIEVKMSILWN
ncbi:MAG: hypothetical protein QF886_13720, partial [Planctomycetota bacterium]|nr:hypothetical protein [Planctomycetota bacterium]